jgi:hypothetical protein
MRPPAVAGPLAVGGVALAAAATVALRSPHADGNYPTCPSAMLGFACPGCGTLRAGHAALNGDIVSAVGYNAALLVAATVLALAWIGWLARSTGRTGPPDLLQMRHSATVTAVAIGTWWVVRLVGIVPAPPLG